MSLSDYLYRHQRDRNTPCTHTGLKKGGAYYVPDRAALFDAIIAQRRSGRPFVLDERITPDDPVKLCFDIDLGADDYEPALENDLVGLVAALYRAMLVHVATYFGDEVDKECIVFSGSHAGTKISLHMIFTGIFVLKRDLSKFLGIVYDALVGCRYPGLRITLNRALDVGFTGMRMPFADKWTRDGGGHFVGRPLEFLMYADGYAMPDLDDRKLLEEGSILTSPDTEPTPLRIKLSRAPTDNAPSLAFGGVLTPALRGALRVHFQIPRDTPPGTMPAGGRHLRFNSKYCPCKKRFMPRTPEHGDSSGAWYLMWMSKKGVWRFKCSVCYSKYRINNPFADYSPTGADANARIMWDDDDEEGEIVPVHRRSRSPEPVVEQRVVQAPRTSEAATSPPSIAPVQSARSPSPEPDYTPSPSPSPNPSPTRQEEDEFMMIEADNDDELMMTHELGAMGTPEPDTQMPSLQLSEQPFVVMDGYKLFKRNAAHGQPLLMFHLRRVARFEDDLSGGVFEIRYGPDHGAHTARVMLSSEDWTEKLFYTAITREQTLRRLPNLVAGSMGTATLKQYRTQVFADSVDTPLMSRTKAIGAWWHKDHPRQIVWIFSPSDYMCVNVDENGVVEHMERIIDPLVESPVVFDPHDDDAPPYGRVDLAPSLDESRMALGQCVRTGVAYSEVFGNTWNALVVFGWALLVMKQWRLKGQAAGAGVNLPILNLVGEADARKSRMTLLAFAICGSAPENLSCEFSTSGLYERLSRVSSLPVCWDDVVEGGQKDQVNWQKLVRGLYDGNPRIVRMHTQTPQTTPGASSNSVLGSEDVQRVAVSRELVVHFISEKEWGRARDLDEADYQLVQDDTVEAYKVAYGRAPRAVKAAIAFEPSASADAVVSQILTAHWPRVTGRARAGAKLVLVNAYSLCQQFMPARVAEMDAWLRDGALQRQMSSLFDVLQEDRDLLEIMNERMPRGCDAAAYDATRGDLFVSASRVATVLNSPEWTRDQILQYFVRLEALYQGTVSQKAQTQRRLAPGQKKTSVVLLHLRTLRNYLDENEQPFPLGDAFLANFTR